MIFKIYILISVLTLAMILITNASILHSSKSKLKDKIDINEKDRAGILIAYLKIAIISFIPFVNIFLLFILVFFNGEIDKRVDKLIDESVSKKLDQ